MADPEKQLILEVNALDTRVGRSSLSGGWTIRFILVPSSPVASAPQSAITLSEIENSWHLSWHWRSGVTCLRAQPFRS